MATNSLFSTTLFFNPQNPLRTLEFNLFQRTSICNPNVLNPNSFKKKAFTSLNSHLHHNPFRISRKLSCISSKTLSIATPETKNYEFSDGGAELELRLPLGGIDIQDSPNVHVDADENSLKIRVQSFGSSTTLMETSNLYGKIKPAETIWYIDEDQLVVNLKKHDPDLKWPDVMESWEALTAGGVQILKGTSIYIVGDSTEINEKVARELALGLGYTPLNTSELLETYAKQTIASWVIAEGVDSVANAECAILESLSSYVRSVVATLGGEHGAARRADKWRHLYAGFTIWLSLSEASDEDAAKEEARRQIQQVSQGYSNADVVVKLGGWDPNLTRTAAQSCLSALKKMILSDKKLPGKKSLYIRLGCRGDWPNIKPPGWDPSSAGADESSEL